MTLSGVLKDILLVMASMAIFRDPVSPLQAFGYTIALCGLIYYKIGADKTKEYVGQGQRAWADYGVRHPIARRVVVIGMVFFGVVVLLGGMLMSGVLPAQYDYAPYAKSKVDELLGKGGS